MTLSTETVRHFVMQWAQYCSMIAQILEALFHLRYSWHSANLSELCEAKVEMYMSAC